MRTKLLFGFILFTFQFAVAKEVVFVDPVAPSVPPLAYCDTNNDGFGTFNLTELNSSILAAQSGIAANYSITYHENFTDAQIGGTAIVYPSEYYNINPWNQTVYYRIRNVSTSEYAVGSFALIVNPRPVATIPSDYHLCDVFGVEGYENFDLTTVIPQVLGSIDPSSVAVSFYVSQSNAQNGINQIGSVGTWENSTMWEQTLYVRVAVVSTGCYDVVPLRIVVDPLPNLVPPSVPYTICDDNQDGTATFDLTTLIPGLLNGGSYSITFHETYIDALVYAGILYTPSTYMNITPFTQTVYARGADTVTGCTTIVPITLQVNPSPVAGSVPSIAVCDADANPQNGVTSINLTQQTAAILALQPLPASNYSVTYYTTLTNAYNETAPILPATSYIGSNGETIWYRVENNSTHCYNVGSFQLIINMPLALTTPTVLAVCDDDATPNNQYTTFDLTVKNFEITQSLPGYTVTYFPSLANAQTGTNAITSPTAYVNSQPAIQTLGVKVISPFGCESLTTLDIRVYPIPAPNTNPNPITVCDTDGDGIVTVDLTVNSTYIINGDPNLVLHFYHTMADALANVNQILAPLVAVVGGNVWIRVENNRIDYQGNHCFVLVEQPIVISGLPMVTEPNYPQYALYDYGNDGYETFDLTTQIGNILLGQTGMAVAFYPSFVDAQNDTNIIMNPSAYVNTVIYVQTLGIRVFNIITGCYSISTIDILVTPEVPSPAGLVYWTFTPGQTLADIVIYGNNIQWYSSASGRTALSTPLPLSTLLVDGTTYYASQTINGIESTSRLAVTVHATLEVNDNEILPIQYAPNPVKSNLTLQSKVIIKSVSIYTMLGQKVVEQNYNDTTIFLDLSRLATGNYILKVQGETGQKTIRIIKE